MSKTFEDSQTGKVLWNPAHTIGILFYNQMKALEATYKLESGIREGKFGDDYIVEAEQFKPFIGNLVEQLTRTHHPNHFLLIKGCLVMCFMIHWQAVKEWPVVPMAHDELQEILGEAQSSFSENGLPV
jgi:hypothetical protein